MDRDRGDRKKLTKTGSRGLSSPQNNTEGNCPLYLFVSLSFIVSIVTAICLSVVWSNQESLKKEIEQLQKSTNGNTNVQIRASSMLETHQNKLNDTMYALSRNVSVQYTILSQLDEDFDQQSDVLKKIKEDLSVFVVRLDNTTSIIADLTDENQELRRLIASLMDARDVHNTRSVKSTESIEDMRRSIVEVVDSLHDREVDIESISGRITEIQDKAARQSRFISEQTDDIKNIKDAVVEHGERLVRVEREAKNNAQNTANMGSDSLTILESINSTRGRLLDISTRLNSLEKSGNDKVHLLTKNIKQISDEVLAISQAVNDPVTGNVALSLEVYSLRKSSVPPPPPPPSLPAPLPILQPFGAQQSTTEMPHRHEDVDTSVSSLSYTVNDPNSGNRALSEKLSLLSQLVRDVKMDIERNNKEVEKLRNDTFAAVSPMQESFSRLSDVVHGDSAGNHALLKRFSTLDEVNDAMASMDHRLQALNKDVKEWLTDPYVGPQSLSRRINKEVAFLSRAQTFVWAQSSVMSPSDLFVMADGLTTFRGVSMQHLLFDGVSNKVLVEVRNDPELDGTTVFCPSSPGSYLVEFNFRVRNGSSSLSQVESMGVLGFLPKTATDDHQFLPLVALRPRSSAFAEGSTVLYLENAGDCRALVLKVESSSSLPSTPLILPATNLFIKRMI